MKVWEVPEIYIGQGITHCWRALKLGMDIYVYLKLASRRMDSDKILVVTAL